MFVGASTTRNSDRPSLANMRGSYQIQLAAMSFSAVPFKNMLVQRLGHVNASFRSSTAEDLPKPTFSELMADVVSNSSIQQSKQNAFTLKIGPVKVHSVPPASEPRSC